MDTEQRSKLMARIRGGDTGPEMIVRRLIFHNGYRYRIHVKALPGKPDLVFKSRKKVIFVHGCFWHQHGCKNCRTPKSHVDYWLPKLQQNAARDKKDICLLQENGWKVLVVWECELKDREKLSATLFYFLEST